MFDKVLVANRGEIACRVLRTCDRLGIKTVAVFSDADVEAPHVALADEALRLGGPALKDSYLNVELLIDAVSRSGADAVHPGYGLLSENAAFAEAVGAAGACFVGPAPQAMAQLGDKVVARDLARSVGLEPPPGTSSAVSAEAAIEAAPSLGFPVLVKAAAGGGGIGMQVAHDAAQLEKALEVATTRARAAFGDGRVYLEKYLHSPRHIELQLARDSFGNSVWLGERECSVQRRHQKIVEESPSPASFLSNDSGRQRLAELAERARRLLDVCNYEGVATIEFVADATGQLYFLEVNARLQVEHPLTEMRSGVDLVELQLNIASGQRIPPQLETVPLSGHAIEARVYAEDPAKQFMPQPGRLAALTLPSGPGIRVDSGVTEGFEISPYYDPLLLKIIAHAQDREQAIQRLDAALGALVLQVEGKRGSRVTNQRFLRQVLASSDFRGGDYDTGLAQKLLAEADE